MWPAEFHWHGWQFCGAALRRADEGVCPYTGTREKLLSHNAVNFFKAAAAMLAVTVQGVFDDR